MKNDARKMALENQIELAQQNAIDFTHACMTIALHDVFGVGKDRLDKVTQRKDEINGELMRRMAIPAKNQKAQLNEAEKWLVGLLPEGVVSVFRVPVIKGVPRKRREVQLKMAIDRAATLEWRRYADGDGAVPETDPAPHEAAGSAGKGEAQAHWRRDRPQRPGL